MKIVNMETFLQLPPNTLFCEVYEDNIFNLSELAVKGESIGDNDFGYKDLVVIDSESDMDLFVKQDNAEKELQANGSTNEITLDFDCTARDGLYAKGRFFAVFSKEDVKGLIGSLLDCVNS